MTPVTTQGSDTPADIPQVVWNVGAKMAGEYLSWLNAGNSTGNLSEHAVAAIRKGGA